MTEHHDYLKKHVADKARLRRLRSIESSLTEHEFPPQLVIENTSYCNLKCIHCSHREMIRAQRHMERSLWNKIAEEIGRESPDCEVWPTFYGEALILGDELWDRLNYAAEVGCRNLVLNSNGTLLERKDNIEKVLRSPLKRFILSLDGLSKDVFEHIRRGAKWERVYGAVVELCRRRAERGQKYPVIIAQFSVLKQNVQEVEAYRDFWKNVGAEVKVRPMLEWTASGSVRSDTIDHGTALRMACAWANHTMAVHQSGQVVACAVDYEGRLNAGNLRLETIRDVWQRLRSTLRDPHRMHQWSALPEICKGCADWQAAGADYEEEAVGGTRPFWYYGR